MCCPGLAFGFGVVLLEFIPIVFCLGAAHSGAVRMVELAVRMCLPSRLLVRSRRLRQGKFLKTKMRKVTSDILKPAVALMINDKTGCQFQDQQTVAGQISGRSTFYLESQWTQHQFRFWHFSVIATTKQSCVKVHPS